MTIFTNRTLADVWNEEKGKGIRKVGGECQAEG